MVVELGRACQKGCTDTLLTWCKLTVFAKAQAQRHFSVYTAEQLTSAGKLLNTVLKLDPF